MTFSVTAIDAQGTRRMFTREAASADALRAALKGEGLVVIAAVPSGTASDASSSARSAVGGFGLRPMTAFDVEMGLRQLSAMLKSGVALLAALETVADQASSVRARRTWSRVAKRVMSGSPFAQALEAEGRRFGEIAIRLAEVGERSGELEHALRRAADQLESRRALRMAVVNALVYPILAVVMAVAVSTYLVLAVIPKLADFLRAGGAALPAVTQALMDVSDWIGANGLKALGALALAVAAWWVVRLAGKGRDLEDAFLLRLPVTGRILRLSNTALFARAMQIMTESGVTLIDALATAGRLLANRRCRRRVLAARERVVRGETLAAALRDAREFLPMLRRMVAVGEVTGALPETFGETARFHEMLLAVAVKRFGMLIEPVMIVITGGIVGFVYVAFFVALFAIAGTA